MSEQDFKEPYTDGSRSSRESAPFLHSQTPTPRRHQKWQLSLSYHLLTIVCTSFVWWIFANSLSTLSPYSAPKTKTLTCGTSTPEAKSLGCEFDTFSGLWLPAPCIEHDLLAEYKIKAPWRGYATKNSTDLLSEEEMAEMTGPEKRYWTPVREHMIHCAMMWRRLHLGYMRDGGRKMQPDVLDYKHTVHCATELVRYGEMQPWHLEERLIATSIGYGTCEVDV